MRTRKIGGRMCMIVTLVMFPVLWGMGFGNVSRAEAAEPVIQWKLQDTYEPVSIVTRHITLNVMKAIEEITQGQIKITRYEPGAFVGPLEALDGLSKGMYDMAAFYPGYYVGRIPLANVEQGLPFGWTNLESAYTSYRKFGFEKLLREEYAKRNIFWLTGGTLNDIYNIGSSKPIRKLADAKGMKIRAVGVYGDYVKLFGATPVVIPSGELYMALKLRTIDGQLGSPYYYETHKLGEVLKYYLLPNTNNIGFNLCVNMSSWNKLPEKTRNLVVEMLSHAFWAFSVSYGEERKYTTDKLILEKYGVEYTTLPKDEEKWVIEESQKTIWSKIAGLDPACAKGVEIVKQSREHLGMITAK
jgi:TRAP-type C4-dicarboxylate transport system substrate-binding protein